MTYHLKILDKIGQLNKFRHKNITRYYSIDVPTQELDIISHLRVNSEKEIILFILEHDLCTFDEIVEHSRKAPSTISWHLKRLYKDRIIIVHYGEYHLYRINDEKSLSTLQI